MPEYPPSQKILIAVDGSEQSFRAIRYAADVFPPDRTQIVLFNVRVQLFDLFTDLKAYPHYQHRVTGSKRWASEQNEVVSQAVDRAAAYFKQKGFPETAVTNKTAAKKLGIVTDIINESYNGYDAIVVGRTGLSRLRDWLIKSTAKKLVAKVKHVPLIVVGGEPAPKNVLVAFDGTHGAMKGVASIGALVGAAGHHLLIYSLIPQDEKFWEEDASTFLVEKTENCDETVKHPLGPLLKEVVSRLLIEGMTPDRISIKIEAINHDPAAHIVQEAMQNHCGGVVLGRRVSIPFIDEHLMGRVSGHVLKQSDKLAVWVI